MSEVAERTIHDKRFPGEPWSKIVQRDMAESDIRVEIIPTREEARRLVAAGKRAAVVVFGPPKTGVFARLN